MVIPEVKEHCDGNCVWQHEDEHRKNLDDCCQKWHKCYEKYKDVPGGAVKCYQAYDMWLSDPDQRDWDECQAYKREETCLTGLTSTCTDPEKGCPHEEPKCCNKLKKELKFTKKMQAKHCPGLKKECPFTPDGEPIGVK